VGEGEGEVVQDNPPTLILWGVEAAVVQDRFSSCRSLSHQGQLTILLLERAELEADLPPKVVMVVVVLSLSILPLFY
jgi:hypothetical protein